MNNQKGVSLIIIFFIMTIILAAVLGVDTIIFNEVKIMSDSGNSVTALYAADTGIEKTLYFDRKQLPAGGTRGFCNTCNACSGSDCVNCILTTPPGGNCGLTTCTNCQLGYTTTFGGKQFTIFATVSPNVISPSKSDLTINSTGLYNNVQRQVNAVFTSTSVSLAYIVVIDHVTSSSTTASSFTVHVKSGSSDVSGSPQPGSETGTTYAVNPGTYTVSETAPFLFNVTFSGNCNASGSITAVTGQTKTCTITSTPLTNG